MSRSLRWVLAAWSSGCGEPTEQLEPRADPPVTVEAAPDPGPPTPEPSRASIDALREQILAHAKLEPGMVVVEIGASEGWFVDRAAIAVGVEGRVYATDIDPQAIAAIEQLLSHANPTRSPVDVRLCASPRDPALADLPADHVDVMLMIDSLCFDHADQREQDVVYLREFLRVLEPGGRLIHHMDCGCRTSPAQVGELFEAAGFVAGDALVATADAPAHCSSAEARERHAFVATFVKPRAEP